MNIAEPPMPASRASAIRDRLSGAIVRHPYAATGLMLSVATGLGLLTFDLLKPANVEALFLLVVLVTALKGGRRPGLFAALAATIVFNFCFIPPRFSFAVTDFAYFVTLFVFVVVAMTTSELASRAVREQVARTHAEAATQAKDALLNRIAHELRAPLTTILGWVQILQQTANDAQRTTRGLAGLQRNAQLLARLVGDLLDVSRIHVGKLRVRLQPLMLGPVIRRALEDVAIAAAEKGVTLDCAVEPIGNVLADEQRIEQVVTNLVSNALKFTPARGRVNVKLSEKDGCARLVVADTGEGISSDFLAHVFEPFAQGQSEHSSQGLGLGLAIVKHLVDAHHGRISAESAGAGQGTTFVVELPLADASAALEGIDVGESQARTLEPAERTVVH
jgi:K+-sensing histidine kinase KdpD